LGTGGQISGGDGDDDLSTVNAASQRFGHAGNDSILMNGLGQGDDGEGDDMFTILHSPRYSAEDMRTLGPLTATGGEGDDMFGILANNTTNVGVTITDFTPEDDLLVFVLPGDAGESEDFDVMVRQDVAQDVTNVIFTRSGTEIGRATLDRIVDIAPEGVGVIRDFEALPDAAPGENFDVVRGTNGNDTIEGDPGDTIRDHPRARRRRSDHLCADQSCGRRQW